ncbi:Phosphonate-transporting ATPase [[Leptolyngbya] sp. PCC 7376]|uniref:ABC transporter ATP-binding protein n=1 Tax=[Leptolyngbya] sp. PCC 7376 TaxID=111781 RepID=UPI00029F0A79|nr:ABC transporter ATP-binding protein [[Leptolyngbya] sp. PCC 7376]AFY38192.1 Phosphonate-transporting ATPase [[Leptolyngbya] sp. PCC 7376]
MIEIRNLSKIYGSGETTVYALRDVELQIKTGEYCSIMGASGSGKSTLMNIIGCLDQPTKGDYFLNNENVSTLSDRQLALIRNQNIGFVFQQFHLLPQLSALENVILPMIYGNVSPQERRARAVAALTKVGLANRLHNRPNQLSGGQQQRVAIARAIVNEPLLLLADEPTGALDSKTTHEILDLFSELQSTGMGVVMVTHENDVAAQTNRIIWLKDGEVTYAHLTPEEMRDVTMAQTF